MLFSLINLSLISINIIGFSVFCKRLIVGKNLDYQNLDFSYGIFFLIFFSLFVNFFSPLNFISFPVFILGIILFFYYLLKKKIQFYVFFIILINFFLLFISDGNDLVYDSKLYHLQTIKYNSDFKSIFGLGNLEPRLAMNSTYHSLIALFNFNLFNQNIIYLFNISLYSFFILIFFDKTLNGMKISNLTFKLSLFFILIYSFLHPWKNGTILNNLGSPEVDTIAMFFFISSFTYFIKFVETKDIDYLRSVIIFSIITITFKLSYIYLFLLLLYLIYYFRKYFSFNMLIVFIFLMSMMWIFKSIILSGCIIFPIKFTCIDLSWSLGTTNVEGYKNIIQSFNRTLPDNLNWNDFDYTLQSLKWFKPWFISYYLKTEFLLISTLLILISIILIFIKIVIQTKKRLIKDKKIFYFLLLFFLSGLYVWFQSPDIRFGYGYFITLVAYLISIYLCSFENFRIKNYYFNTMFIICIFTLIFNNFNNFKNINKKTFNREFNYQNFEKIYSYNEFDIYKPKYDPFCNSFKNFCSYQSFNVKIKNKKNYIFIENNW
ncbi:hypothetical protein OAY13_00735 [Candidatus Pelagibacter sp.]|nr:hypothetical protein [Candidatus Pelagibacter sp.]